MTQYAASPHTIASYRDAFKLLLGYVHQQTGRLPARLDLTDLDAATIGALLQHLETVRGNSTATRNARLAAIHSLFRYASLQAPDHANLIGRVLAIQTKRTTTTIVTFLDRVELNALLAAPDQSTWHGRRDHALLVVAAQTGLRVSELTGLTVDDVHLGTDAHLYCHGKGRKDRCTPPTTPPTPCSPSSTNSDQSPGALCRPRPGHLPPSSVTRQGAAQPSARHKAPNAELGIASLS
jgi:integrase/recombinase XerD